MQDLFVLKFVLEWNASADFTESQVISSGAAASTGDINIMCAYYLIIHLDYHSTNNDRREGGFLCV